MIKAETNSISTVPTLAEVIARHEEDPSLTPKRRRDLKSAVLRISEMTGVDPRITPASLRFMRPRINAVRPAKYDLTPKTWSNLRSNFRAALVQAAPRQPRRSDAEWEKLRRALPKKRMRTGLSRMIGFCQTNTIPPIAMSDAVSEQFRAYLEADTTVPSPHDCHRLTCRLWNQAAESVPGWPPIHLTPPDSRKQRQSLPISSFPPELQKEFARYIDSLSRGDIFAEDIPRKILRPSTVHQRAAEFGLALSALVAGGRDPASITSLDCLVEPDAFRTILRGYLTPDGKPRPFAFNIGHTLIGLAKRRLGTDPAALAKIEKLQQLQRCLGPERKHLTEKNRALLRNLDDRAVRAKLIGLPERLADWAERTTPARGAVAMEIAVAIGILRSAPLRIANLAGLRLDEHLTRPGGPRALWQIDIPPHQVKNGEPLVYELPQRTTALVGRYLRRFRPSLAEPGNPYLFPAGSGRKQQRVLSQQVRRAIANWVGIDMTPHQFRHFAGRLMLQHSPGAFAAVAQLLGHKDPSTAVAYYSGIDTLSAGRHFDAILEAEHGRKRSRRRS
jgi:integrase